RPRSGRGARRYLPGLPDARPTPALQPDPAQRRGDPLPELPAHALCTDPRPLSRVGELSDPRPMSRVGIGKRAWGAGGPCASRAAAGEAGALDLDPRPMSRVGIGKRAWGAGGPCASRAAAGEAGAAKT